VTNERQGSTDAAADRIRGRPGWAGRGSLGLPAALRVNRELKKRASPGSPRPPGRTRFRRCGGSKHRRLSPGLIAREFTLRNICAGLGVGHHPGEPASKLGRWFVLTDAAALVGLIEKDHELRRGDLPAFSRANPADIALILDPPADTVRALASLQRRPDLTMDSCLRTCARNARSRD